MFLFLFACSEQYLFLEANKLRGIQNSVHSLCLFEEKLESLRP